MTIIKDVKFDINRELQRSKVPSTRRRKLSSPVDLNAWVEADHSCQLCLVHVRGYQTSQQVHSKREI